MLILNKQASLNVAEVGGKEPTCVHVFSINLCTVLLLYTPDLLRA